MNAAPSALVEVDHVRQLYPKGSGENLLVLDDVSLSLRKDEIVSLLGRSGCGKSSLLRIIAGLMPASQGKVSIGGRDVAGPAQEVAMVFQTFALFPWLTVLENVEIGLEAQGIAPEQRHKRALAAIDLIGLDGYESAYPKELSGGMRQRVGLARALVVHPKVLLMDEPFSALDVLTAETLRTDLLDLWCEGRMPISSILMVTHNIEEAVLMSDRILVFSSNPGRILAEVGDVRRYRSAAHFAAANGTAPPPTADALAGVGPQFVSRADFLPIGAGAGPGSVGRGHAGAYRGGRALRPAAGRRQ